MEGALLNDIHGDGITPLVRRSYVRSIWYIYLYMPSLPDNFTCTAVEAVYYSSMCIPSAFGHGTSVLLV